MTTEEDQQELSKGVLRNTSLNLLQSLVQASPAASYH
jgi:hypothetical protein